MWGGLFDKDIDDLCAALSLDAFSREGSFAIKLRRDLQTAYMTGLFSASDSDDLLIRASHIIPIDNSLVKRVINNLCLIYNEGVNRSVSPDVASKFSEIQYDDFLDSVHKLGKFNGNVLVFVGWEHGKIKLQTMTPAWFRWKNIGSVEAPVWELWIAVIREVNNKLAYDIAGSGYEWQYHVWTDTEYKFLANDKKVLAREENKYGKIPFVEVNFSGYNKYDYYDTSSGKWDLLERQLMVNTLQFSSIANSVYSNVSILWMDNIGVKEGASFGLGKVLITRTDDGTERKIEFINAQGNFTETDNFKQNIVKDTLKNEGLPSAVVNSGGIMSGEALKVDRIELEEQRKADLKLMEFYERQISRMIDLVSEREGYPYKIGDYSITFNDLDYVGDPVVKYNFNKMKFNDNLITIIDLMREVGYIGTDEELLEILQNIKEENDKYRITFADADAERQGSQSSEEQEGAGSVPRKDNRNAD